MAENDPKPPEQSKAAPAKAQPTRVMASTRTTEDEVPNPDEVEIDERYVGVDPIYANSAYHEPGEPETTGDDEEADEAVEAELEMIERVKENEEGCKVQVDEAQPFEEWVGTTDLQARKSSVLGVDDERVEADQQKLEEAKNENGKIPPHSTSLHQPGVSTAT